MTFIVSLSGGVDSTSALDLITREHAGEDIRPFAFNYGQRHLRELDAAEAVARHYQLPLTVVDLTGLLSGSSLLGVGEVPDGHYAEASMAATVVNGRNLLFASVLIAQARPGDTVVLGVHAGDHHVYADCRPEFVDHLRGVAAAYDVGVWAPWVDVPKSEAIYQSQNAPFGLTWSCYKGGDKHCGSCGTCVERAEAFRDAGVDDPTEYASPPVQYLTTPAGGTL